MKCVRFHVKNVGRRSKIKQKSSFYIRVTKIVQTLIYRGLEKRFSDALYWLKFQLTIKSHQFDEIFDFHI